jgi:hypothetical protein
MSSFAEVYVLNPAKKDQKRSRNVRFSDVTVREYPIIIGDNPGGVKKGPPLTIAWLSVSSISMSLDTYEQTQEPRRTELELQMTVSDRVIMLRNLGFSRNDINLATKEAYTARMKRKETRANLDDSDHHERREAMVRTAQNIMTLGTKHRREKAFLKQSSERSLMIDSQKTRGGASLKHSSSETSLLVNSQKTRGGAFLKQASERSLVVDYQKTRGRSFLKQSPERSLVTDSQKARGRAFLKQSSERSLVVESQKIRGRAFLKQSSERSLVVDSKKN